MPGGLDSLPISELPGAVRAAGDFAAVIIEPVQGERGCHPVGNLAELRAACDATGTLLIYDEVQCGLGRTGHLHVAPAPDIRTLAKALGGGLPLGAVVAAPHLADAFAPGDHGSTFGGNPVACAAGLATLTEILARDLPARCASMGARLREGLAASDGLRITIYITGGLVVVINRKTAECTSTR
jgi:acetylornithine/succinyldiaminopimelate/putrescine aminotransferase